SMSSLDINEQRALIKSAHRYISEKLEDHFSSEFLPKALVICGSGLSGISTKIADEPKPLILSYSTIPGFKVSTVPGHSGELIFGYMNGAPVVLMNGRLHSYEGHSLAETVHPIRALHLLGSINVLIVTNAAGGINASFKAGDLMCVYDHINFPGLCGFHPLRGANFDEFGPRFLATSDAYDLELRKLLFSKKKELNIERKIHEGTYSYVHGPTFESRAESRFLRLAGTDAVGMSTVPEVVTARHCGWRVLALSLITNECVVDPPASAHDENPVPIQEGKATHEEVLENSAKASKDVQELIFSVVAEI
uniref:Purine nucleoside phosphorylase n=1 Tax=Kluyveromyces lactis (strain ATCC 8585 / CBS 2359 / DSM 70799 / NBRC 1267 / NRRL Y-1140 / WM37) TaxID=284590 RepID=UPI00292A5E16